MAKSKLKPTLEDAFNVGKLEGQRELLQEMDEMMTGEFSVITLKAYLKARLKTVIQTNNNPFKRKDRQ